MLNFRKLSNCEDPGFGESEGEHFGATLLSSREDSDGGIRFDKAKSVERVCFREVAHFVFFSCSSWDQFVESVTSNPDTDNSDKKAEEEPGVFSSVLQTIQSKLNEVEAQSKTNDNAPKKYSRFADQFCSHIVLSFLDSFRASSNSRTILEIAAMTMVPTKKTTDVDEQM